MKEISLFPFKLVRPEKVKWFFPSAEDIFDSLQSKSLRQFLKKADAKMDELGISWREQELDEEMYQAWLKYYEQNMSAKGYAIFATPHWLKEKHAAGQKVFGLFFYRHEQMIGSLVYVQENEHVANAAYKASEHIEELSTGGASLGAVIDYIYLRVLKEKGVKDIFYGRSRNAFGAVNNFGYLEYKLKFGFQPFVPPETPLLTTVQVNEEGTVAFYGLKDTGLSLYFLKPKNSELSFKLARFSTTSLPTITLEYDAH
jgi:hypothetical protein